MKKTILILFILATSFVANAQKRGAGDKLLTFGVMNNSGFLVLKSYKDSLRCNRFGVSGTMSYSSNETSDLYTKSAALLYKNTTTSSALNLGFFVGKQKSFSSFKNFEPYIGCDIGLNVSSSTVKTRQEVIDTLYSQNGYSPFVGKKSIGDYTSTLSGTPTKIGLNVIPFLGFNYFLFKNFAIGAEYRLTLASVSYGLPAKASSEISANGIVDKYESKTNRSITGAMNLSGAGFITVSYFWK